MNKLQKIIRMFGLLLAIILFSCNTAKVAEKKVNDSDIKIIYTNDVHGAFTENIGYAEVASLKKELLETNPHTILIDAGDFLQGSLSSIFEKGSEVINIMNGVGYDFAAIGNHEFDYGIDQLKENAKNLKCGMYSCNIFDVNTKKQMFDGYKIFDLGKFKVAFIAVTTPDTLTSTNPKFLKDDNGKYCVTFLESKDGISFYENVQKNIDEVRGEGADYVVLVAHLGNDVNNLLWSSSKLISNVTGIDVCIDAHSHLVYDDLVKTKDEKEIHLVQVGTTLTNVGILTIDKEGNISNVILDKITDKDGNEIKKDEETTKIIETQLAKTEETLSKVLSHTDYLLTINDREGNRRIRKSETNLGDLATDALHLALGGDCVITNGGAIRTDIPVGDITYKSVVSVFPFFNNCCLVKAKGSALKNALEMGARNYPEENGGFLQVSGITYSINPNIPSSVVLDEKGSFVSVDGEYRVYDIKVNNEPLDENKDYKIGGSNFQLRNGGDGYTMFLDSEVVKDDYIVDTEALATYIMTCDMEKYKVLEGEGRIKIK